MSILLLTKRAFYDVLTMYNFDQMHHLPGPYKIY